MIVVTPKRNLLLPVLLTVTVAASLLNSNVYGSPTLIAYFLSLIAAALFCCIVYTRLLFKKAAALNLPLHLLVYTALALYVWLHGIVTHTTGLSHYYWAGNALLLLAVYTWQQYSTGNTKSIYTGISLLALFESVVVFLQFAGLVGVQDNTFICTGTWGNPNVSAMFLAFAVFSLLQLRDSNSRIVSVSFTVIRILVLLAIALLQCRSAYLAVLFLLLHGYQISIKSFIKKHLTLTTKGLAAGLVLMVTLFVGISLFQFKASSAAGRLHIWKTSLQLIAQQPLTGYGFGMFEKQYNMFAAAQKNDKNDHVETPYNDWVEITIEGGLPAIVLWLSFLFLVAKYWHKKRKEYPGLLALLAAFVTVQLTNFGIEAIPANLLFIIYMAIHSSKESIEKSTPSGYASKPKQWPWVLYGISVLIIAGILFISIISISSAFYTNWQISTMPKGFNKIAACQQLNAQLGSYASYQLNAGDAYREAKDYPNAIAAYRLAMQKTSTPDIFTKTGYCYQMLNRYDSSKILYTIAEDMQPYKYIPRMAMLKLYEQQKDTINILGKAREILTMKVKVKSRQVLGIKQYAAHVVQRLAAKQKDSISGRPQ
jgi:O-antigen polymerase